MAGIAGIFSLIGTAVSAMGTIAAGKAQQAAANYEAKQLEIKGKEEAAAAQVESQEQERRKKLALSSLQAKAATSGYSATDPTNLAIADEIAKYGTLQEQMSTYGGQVRKEGRFSQAVARRMEGKAAAQGARLSAMGTILGGIGGMASRMRSSVPSYYSGSSGGYNYYYG